ncbi:MAG: hypothetical protein AAGI72_15570 [Pseudomonadota bacterium]
MPVIPPHQPITSWEDWRDTHQHERRIPFPRRDRTIGSLIIRKWDDETKEIDGLPLSAMVYASRTRKADDPVYRIGIIWSATRPPDKYPIAVLWAGGRQVVRL